MWKGAEIDRGKKEQGGCDTYSMKMQRNVTDLAYFVRS